MGVAEARGFTHAIEGAAESGKDGIFAIAPRPKPRGVNMRVANNVQDSALLAFGNGREGGPCGSCAQCSCAAQ